MRGRSDGPAASPSARDEQADHPVAGKAPSARGRGIPALDGLRAIAVIAVMLYHFGVAHAQGGFLGVDVFFVLSGYLITGQLVTRWVQGGGIRLGAFWAARARRLLPGLAAMLVVTTAAVLLLDRVQLGEFRGDLFAAATYSSNWWYVFHHSSYFVASGRPPVLEHLWSLAVEEQFYLVWPLIIAAVVLAFRSYERRRRALIWLAVFLALASTTVMIVGSVRSGAPMTADPSRWYFGSDSHTMGLLTGAVLALIRHGDGLGAANPPPRRRATRRETLAGLAGLALLLVVLSRTNEFSPWLYRGGFTAIGVLTAGVIAVASRPGLLSRLLSLPWLRAIGVRSYALYLWHWPVACFTRPGLDLPISQNADLLLRFGLTFLLAEASYALVERPVREHGWRPYWARLQELQIGVVRLRTALACTLAVLAAGLMLPAAAAPSQNDLAGGGTVYVSDPGHPGGVRAEGAGKTHARTQPSSTHSVTTTTPRHMKLPSPPSNTPPATHSSPPGNGPAPPLSRQHNGPPPLPGVPQSAAQLRQVRLAVYGDSVPLGAISQLATRFASVRNDAVEGIQAYTLLPQLIADAHAGLLNGDVVVLHTGDNGVIDPGQLEAALASLSGALRVVLAVPYVPREWQEQNQQLIESMAGKYHNVRLMYWDTWVRAHPADVWSDGIHLTPLGATAYTDLVVQVALAH